jgi:hypothetical protein
VIRYPVEWVYEEMAFLAYYLHWDLATLLELEHEERRRWCDEVSKLNRKLADVDAPKLRSIESVRF